VKGASYKASGKKCRAANAVKYFEEEVLKVRTIVMVATLAMLALVAGSARADQENQAIKVRFSQAVQIPGQVLPAGTYWFTILNTSDRETVQIFNEDRSKTLAIVRTINRERPETDGHLAFTLAERTGEPTAIVAWFYPGYTSGHEFLYSKQESKELAMAKHETQISGD
jgi:hypothetical protein